MTRPITIAGEWVFENGDWVFPSNPKQLVEHRIYDALMLWQGEWFMDTEAGVPYRQQLLGHNPDMVMVESIFRRQLQKVEGVKAVQDIQVELDSERTLHIEYNVLVDGDLTVIGAIP